MKRPTASLEPAHLTRLRRRRRAVRLGSLWLLCVVSRLVMAEPTAAARDDFDRYTRGIEQRLTAQHHALQMLAADDPQRDARMRRGELLIEPITVPDISTDGALLHHWRGTAFVPGATAADFEHLLRNFRSYPIYFAPEVLSASVARDRGDELVTKMRVRQHHILTVVLDATYDVQFAPTEATRGYSISRSTRIDEIADAGTRSEHALSAADEHGFLWRLNTYWSWEQRDGGLYIQIEAVSLTRSIPRGVAWAVRPYTESIPRESLAFTLQSASNALRH